MFHFPAAQDGVGIGVATIFKKMCRILSFLQERGGISGWGSVFDRMNMPVEGPATIKELMVNAAMAGIYIQTSKSSGLAAPGLRHNRNAAELPEMLIQGSGGANS